MGEIWSIGIDGGGSKTRIAACDDSGKLKYRGLGASANHQSTADAADNLREVIAGLKKEMAAHGAKIATAAFAMSGWDFARDREIMDSAIERALASSSIVPDKIVIDNDIFAVLKSGLRDTDRGICLIAGAGVLGAAITPGARFRTWGLGYDSGEWGAGSDIGREALYRVIASGLGREEPCPILESKTLKFYGIEPAESGASDRIANAEALAELRGDPDFKFESFISYAAEVFDAANENCPSARGVLEKAGKEHAKTVRALLEMVDGSVPLVLGGGLFQHNGILPGFFGELGEDAKRITEIRLVRSDPLWGSLLWACEESGWRNKKLAFEDEIRVERIEAIHSSRRNI